MRLLSIDSLSSEGITQGKVSLLAHSDGGCTISVEEWVDDFDDNGEPAPAIYVAVGNLTDEGAAKAKAWFNEVVK